MRDVFFCGLLAHDLDGLVQTETVAGHSADVHYIDAPAEGLQIHRSGSVCGQHILAEHGISTAQVGYADLCIAGTP